MIKPSLRPFVQALVLVLVCVLSAVAIDAFADRTRIFRYSGASSTPDTGDAGYDIGYDAGDVLGNDQGVDAGYDVGLDASFNYANGSDDYVTCSNRAGFAPGSSGTVYSVFCWYRRTAIQATQRRLIGINVSGDEQFYFNTFNTGGVGILDDFIVGLATDASNVNYGCSRGINSTAGAWDLVGFVWNTGAGSPLMLSVDGDNLSVGSCFGSPPASLRTSGGALAIGNNAPTANSPFDGDIGPCYIWDVALSNAQISTLYNSGTPLPIASISPAPKFALNGCIHQGSGGFPNYVDEFGGADCVATNMASSACTSAFPP